MRCARQAAMCLEAGRPWGIEGETAEKIANEVQNRPRNHKILVPGAVLKPSGDPLVGSLGALLRFLARSDGDSWRRWAQDGHKMGQAGSKLRPRWAMIAPRWPCWDQFGSFRGPGNLFGHLFRDLRKNCQSVQTINAITLLAVFWGLGPPEGPRGCLESALGAMLEDVGSKMVFSWLS